MAEASAPVLEFEVPTTRPDVPQVTFKLNGQSFTVNRPKLSIATAMVRLLEQPDPTIGDFGVSLASILQAFTNYVVTVPTPEPEWLDAKQTKPNVWVDSEGKSHKLGGLKRGRSRLIERLQDPDDAMDILELELPFRRVIEVMFNRPIGPSPASSPKQRPAGGRSSRGTTRSIPVKTSGTSRRTSSSSPAKRTR